jgi:flagellar hook-associated protein 1 FlgK
MNDRSGVNVDEEMAYLIRLQTAYGANARVMSTIKEMIDMLLSI